MEVINLFLLPSFPIVRAELVRELIFKDIGIKGEVANLQCGTVEQLKGAYCPFQRHYKHDRLFPFIMFDKHHIRFVKCLGQPGYKRWKEYVETEYPKQKD